MLLRLALKKTVPKYSLSQIFILLYSGHLLSFHTKFVQII